MKILNIDTFAQVKRQISMAGVLHDVREVSVQQFINSLKAAEELEAANQGAPETLSQQVENSVNSICDSIPSIPREVLLKQPIEALHAIMQFIRGEFDPDASADEVGDDAAVEKKAE